MSCPYTKEELSAYVDAELDDATQTAIREHLHVCPACRREVAWMKTVAQMVQRLPRLDSDAAITWKTERLASGRGPVPGCAVVLPEASALLDDELPAESKHAVLAHLASCEACYRAFKEIEHVSEMVGALPRVPVPEGLEARILAAVEAEKRFSLRRLLGSLRDSYGLIPRFAPRFAAAAALLFAIGVGAWFTVRHGSRGPVEFVKIRTATVIEEPTLSEALATESPKPIRVHVAEIPRHGLTREAPPITRPATPTRPIPDTELLGPPPLRGPEPREEVTPTIRRPPGEARVVAAPPGAAFVPPRAEPAEPDKAIAWLGPEAVASDAHVATPAATAPSSAASKTAPPEEEARPHEMPVVRVAEAPPAETDPDIHVHVARTRPTPGDVTSSPGIDSRSLKAAETRLNNSVRALSRSRPKDFPISH